MLDYHIAQGGRNLSGGQRQRLTIARAFVKQPEILILDDSASALDYATDARLRKAISEMKNRPTTFIVSQRTASLRSADRIIVLEDGEVAGIGTHDELIKIAAYMLKYMVLMEINRPEVQINEPESYSQKIFKYLTHYKLSIIFSLLFAFITVAGQLAIPVLQGKAIDRIIGAGNVDIKGIITILIIIAVTVAATALFQWIMNVINNKITYSIVRDIRKDAFEKLQILPVNYVDTHPAGEIVSKVIADVDQFADGLLMGFTQFLQVL